MAILQWVFKLPEPFPEIVTYAGIATVLAAVVYTCVTMHRDDPEQGKPLTASDSNRKDR